jgi:transcriptional regulator with XRE-family HTH domain
MNDSYPSEYKKLMGLLLEQRLKLELTQKQFAKLLRKPQSYVAKYETGARELSVTEFMNICHELGVRPSKLMTLAQ